MGPFLVVAKEGFFVARRFPAARRARCGHTCTQRRQGCAYTQAPPTPACAPRGCVKFCAYFLFFTNTHPIPHTPIPYAVVATTTCGISLTPYTGLGYTGTQGKTI